MFTVYTATAVYIFTCKLKILVNSEYTTTTTIIAGVYIATSLLLKNTSNWSLLWVYSNEITNVFTCTCTPKPNMYCHNSAVKISTLYQCLRNKLDELIFSPAYYLRLQHVYNKVHIYCFINYLWYHFCIRVFT